MRKRIEHTWETMDAHTHRLKVIGGWIVLHETSSTANKALSESMCFVPDRDHEWTVLPPSYGQEDGA